MRGVCSAMCMYMQCVKEKLDRLTQPEMTIVQQFVSSLNWQGVEAAKEGVESAKEVTENVQSTVGEVKQVGDDVKQGFRDFRSQFGGDDG